MLYATLYFPAKGLVITLKVYEGQVLERYSLSPNIQGVNFEQYAPASSIQELVANYIDGTLVNADAYIKFGNVLEWPGIDGIIDHPNETSNLSQVPYVANVLTSIPATL